MPYCKHFLSIILLFSGLNVMLAQRVSLLSGEKADLFTDNAINGSLASTNSKLIDKIKTSLAGHPGYQFSSSMFDGNATGIYRMALVKGRLYFIGVITLTDGINPEIEAFFNSFRLKG